MVGQHHHLFRTAFRQLSWVKALKAVMRTYGTAMHVYIYKGRLCRVRLFKHLLKDQRLAQVRFIHIHANSFRQLQLHVIS